jgi:hypothetical protein
MGIALFKKAATVSVAVSCLTVLTACGNSEQIAQARRELEASKAHLERHQAVMAVEMVTANYGMIRAGGYQSWTAEKAAAQLLSVMRSTKAPGHAFTYVRDTVTGPWQVVLKTDGDDLKVAAYGSSTAQPVEERTITVRRY